MRKMISCILALCLTTSLIATMPMHVSAASNGTCGGNLRWTLNSSGQLTISGTGDMYDWNSTDQPWYSVKNEIKTVKIENGVTSIGKYAFSNCEYLTSVKISDSVTSIGKGAFYSSDSLSSITLPYSVTSIGPTSFSYCTKLTRIEIPSGVTSIGSYAFDTCSSLTSIKIPDSVTSIGKGAFGYCPKLTSINVDADNNYFSSQNGVLFNKNKTVLVCYLGGNTKTEYAIPNSVRSIGENAFVASKLTSIKIPDSVTSIGDSAFLNCHDLTNIEMSNSITIIGDKSFVSCGFANITIPEKVTNIGAEAFFSCKNLISIKIPTSVISIGEKAFGYNPSLKDVYYAGTRSSWAKISIGRYNLHLTNALIHYNSDGPKGFDLSATNISATIRTNPTISVYKPGSTTPYAKSFTAISSNSSIVLPIREGNTIRLLCASEGSATITVTATDGSGIKQVCNVNVTGKVTSEEDDILERIALNRLVYSSLKADKKVGDSEIKANKGKPMFYLTDKTVNWGEFYAKYINDYKILMVPKAPTNGFYAAAFENPVSGDVIIAYRGTELKDWLNDIVVADAGMVFGVLTPQFDQAIKFYDDVKRENSGKNIEVTGYSLGGALASYVAINRQVKCVNVNGATDWLFNCDVIDDNNKYYVDYAGYDKYVFENINDSFLTGNSLITKFVHMDEINHSYYADSQNYNKKTTKRSASGYVYDELTKDYHNLAILINYANKEYSLTKKTKEYRTSKGKERINSFIGTSTDDIYTRLVQARVPGRNPRPVVPVSAYVLSGEGNDIITLPSNSDDTIIGNAGDDTLNGGAGNDTYVYGGNFGHDTIIDPSGNDKIVFTDVSLSNLTISGNKITCGSNSITISSQSKRKADFTIVDKNNKTTKILFSNAKTYSLMSIDVDTTKSVQILGNATIEIYDAYEEIVDALTINEETTESVEYKDYGMVVTSSQAVDLTLPDEGYIIKVKSDETVSVLAISDADNPTVARQTFVENKNLSDGSMIVINTGEMVEEQLSVKLVNGTNEEVIYTPTPESFVITADKTKIKTGETVTMSVPDFYAAAVQWESISGNAIITKNDDLSVNVTGYTAGEDTIRAYLPNDELYSAEISIQIAEDSAPAVTITSNDESYDGTIIATDSVLFDVAVSEGYDTVIFDTQSSYSQIEDTNTFIVNEVGEHTVNIYCKNLQTGAITKAFTFEFSQDSEAPIISGIENEEIYYTDRIIEVTDDSLDAIYLNGELCNETFIVSDVGNYVITATDTAGNTAEVSFEIKTMPLAENIKQADSEKVGKVRNDFEEVKYLLPEERMNELEELIHQLEEVLYTVIEVTSFTAETTEDGALIEFRIANAPVDSTIYVASYNSLGKMLEIHELILYDGIGEEIFSTKDVYNYKAFVCDSNIMPFVKPSECYLQ